MADAAGRRSVEARTVDISLGGVGIALAATFARGDLVTIVFRLDGRGRGPVEERVLGRVAYVRADVDGNRIGVEFLEPLASAACPELCRRVDRL